MHIQQTHHCGLGNLYQNEPIWGCGARVFWTPYIGARARARGGLHPNLTYTYSGSTDPYTYLDPGKGQYTEVSGASPILPLDGHFVTTRSNTYNTSDGDVAASRGPFTAEGGLTISTPAIVDYHILRTDGGGPSTILRLQNTSGSAKRAYRQETSSATLNKMWSILVRRTDGGVIDGTVLTMGASALADPLGANLNGSTRYTRIRSDGWYQVNSSLPIQGGAPDVYYWISLNDGFTIDVEAPQSEGYTTTIALPTPPILTAGSPDNGNRQDHVLFLEGGFNSPACGWLGCTVIPHASTADTTYPTSVLSRLQIDANNLHQIFISSSAQAIVYECRVASVAQAFLQTASNAVIKGTPLGVVATWGYRLGSVYFYMAVNGSFIELDTAGSIPTGTYTLHIGSISGSNVANSNVQAVAVGDRALSRSDCLTLSKWFQRRAMNTGTDMVM